MPQSSPINTSVINVLTKLFKIYIRAIDLVCNIYAAKKTNKGGQKSGGDDYICDTLNYPHTEKNSSECTNYIN